MNKPGLLLAAAALTLSTVSAAADYQFELGGSLFDYRGDVAYGADFSWHFEPVRRRSGPLDQLGFINRSSNIQIDYLRDGDDAFDVTSGTLELYLQGFYVSLGASRLSNGADVDSYSLRGGWMTGVNTRFTGGWDHIESRGRSSVDILTVGIKHVQPLASQMAFHIDAEIGTIADDVSELAHSIRADYYPNPLFGLGLRSSGIGSDNSYGLGTRYFFSPRISGGFEWLHHDASATDTFQFRLAARF